MFKKEGTDFPAGAKEYASVEVKTFQPRAFGAEVISTPEKMNIGSLVQPDTSNGTRFNLHPASKKSLGIEKEEHRVLESKIQEEVEKRLKELGAQAYQEGFSKGQSDGEKQAQETFNREVQPVYERFLGLLTEFENAKQEIFLANEQFLIELVFQVGRQVLLKELKADPDYIKRLCVLLVKQIGAKDHVKIKISRGDFQQIETIRDYLKQQFVELKNVQIDVSDDLENGGCKVETDLARINASVETQFQLINQSLGEQ